VIIISWRNYTPGTFLSGWDTLHPEFDFGLNFKRLIFGVWRQEQGLGAVAGHSHMADLPRVFLLWLLHFFFPLNTLRYLYVFFCLLFGPLGIYFLTKYLLRQEKRRETVAFLTAIFYLFHLGTVQQFYVPFEMFPTQYGFLPWIVLATFRFLKKPNRKNALFFILINLFSTPQAYAAHLWYAFFAVYLAFLFLYWLTHRFRLILRRCLTLVTLILAINSFWLLPNLYFIKTSAHIPRQARQNRLFSKEYQLRNRETGYLKDVALARGFYLNWQIYDFEKEKFVNLMPAWNQHLNRRSVKLTGYFFFTLSLAGLIFAFFKKKRVFITLTPFWLGPFVILMNHTPPFEQLFNFLIRFSVFDEALRFVFTKFSILLLFGYAVFLSITLGVIFNHLRKEVAGVSLALATIALIWFAWPIFKGQLISPKMRIKIPQEYFQFWETMKKEEPGVILPLPIYNFAGWQYYRFGYQGAGFIWFGLKQPILDRDFDRWNPQNEEAFREFFYSLYSQKKNILIKTLRKYHIQYIVWDQNIVTPFVKNRDQVLFKNELRRIISELEKEKTISKIASFKNIQIFAVKEKMPLKEIKRIETTVIPAYQWGFFDYAYINHGTYVTPAKINKEHLRYYLAYPWRNYLDIKERLNRKTIQIENRGNMWLLYPKDNPEFKVFAKAIRFPAQEIYQKNPGIKGISLQKNPTESLKYKSLNSRTGTYIELANITHNREYIVGFKSRNIRGLPLRICIKNLYTDICTLYEELGEQKDFKWEFFPLPSMDRMLGYGISIDNISFGDYWSENELEEILFMSAPTERVSRLHISKGKRMLPKTFLVLNQSYDKGWVAIGFEGAKPHILKNHALVNNWANGWEIEKLKVKSEKLKIYIFFWPQILEFLGFGLLAGVITWSLRKK
jgi:hypothetical protein